MYAADLYGASQLSAAAGIATPTQQMGTDDIPSGIRGLFSIHNPLTIRGVFLAVAFGLAGAAGSVRLGKARASASVGGT
jgi:hypothetical protein